MHLTAPRCTSAPHCSMLHTTLHLTAPHQSPLHLTAAHCAHFTTLRTPHCTTSLLKRKKTKKKFRAWLKKVVIVRLKSGENPMEVFFRQKPVKMRLLTGFSPKKSGGEVNRSVNRFGFACLVVTVDCSFKTIENKSFKHCYNLLKSI